VAQQLKGVTMTPELFEQIGAALYGAEWRTPLSRDLGVSYLNVRRWAAGEKFIPPGVADELHELLTRELQARRVTLAAVEAALSATQVAIYQERNNG
jgi:hypothetical protein